MLSDREWQSAKINGMFTAFRLVTMMRHHDMYYAMGGSPSRPCSSANGPYVPHEVCLLSNSNIRIGVKIFFAKKCPHIGNFNYFFAMR